MVRTFGRNLRFGDRVAFLAALVVGVTITLFTHDGEARPWFALAAFLSAVAFIVVYARRPWRSTYAGRAVMLSMSVTALYTAQVVAILWWPFGYGYPYWQEVQEIVYLLIALAVLYKLRALTRPE